MAFVPGPRIAEVEIRAVVANVAIENTLYFKLDQDIEQANLDDLTTNINGIWTVTALPLIPDTYSLTEIYAADLTTNEGLQSSNSTGLPAPGEHEFPPEPINVTIAISFRTGFRGRSRRGRNYWPLMPKVAVVDNEVLTAYTDDIVALYSFMIGLDAVGAGWTWGVASRFHNNAPRASILFTPITNVLIVDSTVDSQRGRLH